MTETKPYSIDRSLLATIKKRFLRFNQQRLERTLSNLAPRQQLFLEVIPLLFHTNHPVLPGYVSNDACCGVTNFTPDRALLKTAKQVSKSFRYKKLVNRNSAIDAIFLMGSIGTIGQSRSSDLDFWICHDPDLNPTQLQQLQQRCEGIEAWGKTLGLSVCFFPMNARDFAAGKVAALSDDASGSTQHKLLLDEFYRTAIHIAGQYPLWWFVHPDHEIHYAEYSRELVTKRFLRETDVIDLGGLDQIPPEEFISAAIWQLYKAIQSPYKSLLKLLLLGSYVRRQSDDEILSIALKKSIYNNQVAADKLDPYLLLFASLSNHLQREGLGQRLELMRRSFYFKVNKPLSKTPRISPASWQRELLSDLVSDWGWDRNKIAYLDAHHNWNAAQVMAEKQLLIAELLNGYQLLTEYARSHPAREGNQLNHDVAILGRKLYAAFERKSGKIERINPGISRDIAEEYLTFYQHQRQSSEWHVATSRKHEALYPAERLHSCPSLIELITWCYCNRILTSHTSAIVKVGENNDQERPIQPLFQALAKWLPETPSEPFTPDFSQRPRPVSLLVVINEMVIDDDAPLRSEYPAANPLSAGDEHINLVQDIHLLCHNSWGEIIVSSHEQRPLEGFIRHLLSLFAHADGLNGCAIEFHCQRGNHTTSLKLRLEQILRQLEGALMQQPNHQAGLFVVALRNELLCIEKRGAQIQTELLYDEEALLDKLSLPRQYPMAIHIDPLSLKSAAVAAIFREQINQAIQVFYLVQDAHAEVFILDERNTLTRYQTPFKDEQSLLRPLHRFIRSTINRLQLSCDDIDSFGIYPVEFFELQPQPGGHCNAQRTHVTTELQNLKFFNMQAIAESGTCTLDNFSIYCDQQHFHPARCDGQLYRQVARQVLSLRHNSERYPCYLTDLDLGDSPQSLVGDKPLQTAHFVMVKNRLEHRLNQALQEI
ncbi:MAG: class I adenylate cyclase [Candidatus Pelagadaptatus aseana]|uniref:class I adenylate cyclase n=1 Tax=Candidatus Pelagadaptatus aseana TaxID=3120508 RepID=UPI0039B1A4DD